MLPFKNTVLYFVKVCSREGRVLYYKGYFFSMYNFVGLKESRED